MVKVELTFSSVAEFEEWRKGLTPASALGVGLQAGCAGDYMTAAQFEEKVIRGQGQANAGHLIPDADVRAHFAARRAETRKFIHE